MTTYWLSKAISVSGPSGQYLACSEWFNSPEEWGDIKDGDLKTEGVPFEMQQLWLFQ